MGREYLQILGLSLALGLSGQALADDPFQLDVSLNGANATRLGFDSVESAINQLDPEQLRSQFNYMDTDQVDVGFFFRGLDARVGFAANSSVLVFNVPGVTLTNSATPDTVTFDGAALRASGTLAQQRAAAVRALRNFIKKNRLALSSLLDALAARSPIDPLAGNPQSLQSQRARGDFEHGFTHKVSQIWGCSTTAFELNRQQPIMVASAGDDLSGILADAQGRAAALQGEDEFSAGLVYNNTSADIGSRGSLRSSGFTLPFSYTVKFDEKPGHKLRFDLPLAMTDTEGAKSYAMGLGAAYTYPLNEVWSLTPAAGIGVTGSEDLGAAGSIGSLSVSSSYTWRLADFAISMGNLVGYYKSLPVGIGDVRAEAEVANSVLTNGLLVSGPNALIAKNLVMEYSLTDTRLFGDEVYSDQQTEVGVSIGRINTEQGVISSYLKAGLSYVKGDRDISGFKLNLAARF